METIRSINENRFASYIVTHSGQH